jgi:hypothetical protein
MLFALLMLAITASLVACMVPRLDRLLAWALGVGLTLLAGFRTGGFDYEEYLQIIDIVQAAAEEDWPTRLFFAKDPLFLLIIEAAASFTQHPRPVFLAVAAISVFTKVAATAAIPRRRTLFLAAYSVFLAPGLEFAAIRAGMAIGLLMLALSAVSRWRASWAVLAVLGHYSVAIAWMGRLLSTHRWMTTMVLALALPLIVPVLAGFGQDDPRYAAYFQNPGTLMALLLPSLTLAANLGLRAARRAAPVPSPLAADAAMTASLLCAALALLFALPFVTVAYRIMEIAWVLMLAQWLALAAPRSRGLVLRLACGGMLLAVLALTNVLRDTWTILVDMPL